MSTSTTVPGLQKQDPITAKHDQAVREQLIASVGDLLVDQPEVDVDDLAETIVDRFIEVLHLHGSSVFSDGSVSFRSVSGRIDLVSPIEASERSISTA